MLMAISKTNVPVDSPPGPARDPLDPGAVLAGPVGGAVGGGLDADRVPGGPEGGLLEAPDVCADGGPEDGAPPVEDADPEVGAADDDGPEPPELRPCELAVGPGEPDTEVGGVPGNVVVHPSVALAQGGGGGYGAVGAAAAVATTPPSKNIKPATRNAADRARRTRPPRP
jgi:hypothetical protein